MTSVVYIRITDNTDKILISLVCAKTRVAPLKLLTIPRLELSAALLSARLVSHVNQELAVGEIPIYLLYL